LTLRLLGKLGGRNRQFLREPLLVVDPMRPIESSPSHISIECSWNMIEGDAKEAAAKETISIPLPLKRCVKVLKKIALAETIGGTAAVQVSEKSLDELSMESMWDDCSRLWTESFLSFNSAAYSKCVMERTKASQVLACFAILRSSLGMLSTMHVDDDDAVLSSEFNMVFLGLMYACMIGTTKQEGFELLKSTAFEADSAAFTESLVHFLAEEPNPLAISVGLELLNHVAQTRSKQSLELQSDILSALCGQCASCKWSNRPGLQDAICCVLENMKLEQSQKHEMELLTTAFVCIKSVPNELSNASAQALCFFVKICMSLYGTPCCQDNSSMCPFVWDALSGSEAKDADDTNISSLLARRQSELAYRPSDEVLRLLIVEMVSSEFSAR